MATNPLAQMISPMNSLLGPDVTQQQYQLQQNQRYADMLMQQAMQEPAQGQMVSGHYVPPSPVQGLAQLLKAYVGRKASDMIPEQQSKLADAQNAQVQKMFGFGGDVAPDQASRMALGGGAMQGDVGPTTGNAGRMQGVQDGTGSALPLIGGDRRASMLLYQLGGPSAYAKALGEQAMPTGTMKELAAAAPIGSPANQKLMQALAQKNTYIAPSYAPEGAGIVLPGQSVPSSFVPKAGIQTNVTPQGYTAGAVPGYAPASASIEQAQAYGSGLGKAQTTPSEMIDASGNTVGTTAARVMGLPQQGLSNQTGQQGSQPVVTKINPVITDIEKGNNDEWRKNVFTPAITQGQTAKNTLDSVAVLRNTNLQTGFGTETKANVANMLASFGVKDAEKFATNAQIFQKEGSKALLDRLASQKGPQTERDAITGRETFVTLSDTPQAKDFTLDLAQSMALQDQRKAGYFQKASDMPEAHKGKLGTISGEWSKIEGSVFDMPIGRTADGKPITMRQKYGIK
jgi:hypothetical protein